MFEGGEGGKCRSSHADGQTDRILRISRTKSHVSAESEGLRHNNSVRGAMEKNPNGRSSILTHALWLQQLFGDPGVFGPAVNDGSESIEHIPCGIKEDVLVRVVALSLRKPVRKQARRD